MPDRVVHARAVLAANAMMAQAVRTMTAPAGLAIRVLAARPMMDPLALPIQDRVGRATAVRVAPVTPVRAERGRTAHRFAGDSSKASGNVSAGHWILSLIDQRARISRR